MKLQKNIAEKTLGYELESVNVTEEQSRISFCKETQCTTERLDGTDDINGKDIACPICGCKEFIVTERYCSPDYAWKTMRGIEWVIRRCDACGYEEKVTVRMS